MRRTLLDLTQNILSALNSDEVNSIGDTTESLQVAEIIKTTYYNIITRSDFPIHIELYQLDASNDDAKPVQMTKPARVSKIEWIKYWDEDSDSSPPEYKYVTVLPVDQFLEMVNGFNTDETEVESYVFTDAGTNFTFRYKTDRQPCYCTVISNQYILFDSFNNTIDSTLQSSKTLCSGQIIPVWQAIDTFIPDLDDQQFSLLLNEAKSLAFFELKQTTHPKAEQESKRQWSTTQRNKSLTDKPSYFDQLANFGRRSRYSPINFNKWWR